MARWLFLAILAVLSWGMWAILSRFIGDSISAAQSQALSTLGILPVMIALGFSGRLGTAGNRRGIMAAFLAGLLGCGGNIAYYYVLNMGEKTSTVIPLTALYPLVTILLAVVLLRERINRWQMIGIILSLAAIYLFNAATVKGVFSAWVLYALIPIVLWGVAGLVQKIATNHSSGELSTLWFHAAFLPVALILLFVQPLRAQPPLKTWVFAILLGLFFSLGNLAILGSFASGGKASIVSPLTALYPMISIPLAIVFFHEQIAAREVVAILLALLSVVALAFETPVKLLKSNKN